MRELLFKYGIKQILVSKSRIIHGNSIMKISCVLCLLTTFLSLECSATTRFDVSENFPSAESLKRYSEEIIDKFTESFQKKMERQRIRHKRSNLQGNEENFHNVPVVLSSEPKLLHSKLSGHSVFSWCCSSLNKKSVFAATKDGTIIFMDSALIPFFTFHTNISILELQAFEHNNRLWLICLHQNFQEYYLQVYEYKVNVMTIERNQQLKLKGQSVFDIIYVHNSVFMAFASNNEQKSTLSLHEWKNTMFDEVATLVLNGRPLSLTMWNMDRTIYIATSLGDKNTSPIIKYNSIVGNKLTWVQQIEIENPLSVKSFEVFGSHYLIYKVVGSSFLYRWSGVHFIQWQKIVSKSDSKAIAGISTLKLLDQEIIAIAEKDMVAYYAQDDSSHYIHIGETHITENADIKKIFLWTQGQLYYLLPVFNDENYPAVVYQLNVTYQTLSSRIYHDSLISCLNEVSTSMDRNQEVINTVSNKLDKIWMKNKKLSVLPTLYVNGSINTNKDININVILVTSNTIPDVLPSDLNGLLEILASKEKLLISDITSTVSKSKNETVNANLKFSNVVKIFMGHIGKILNPTIMNDIMIAFPLNLLTTLGEQNFNHQTIVNNLVTEEATITGVLNNRTIEDFMLLKGAQYASGRITAEDVNATDIILKSNILNDVNLNAVVINSLMQDIKGKKIFEKLSASSINTSGNVNNRNITKELQNMVSINTDHIKMKVDFVSNINITGNIITERFADSFDFHELVDKSVKIYGNEEIKGDRTFLLPLEIENNLSIKSVNGIIFNDILTLSTAQDITGHFEFPRNTSFQKNIFTGTINDINFYEDVVTQQEINHVSAHKFFSKSLHVSDIEMSDRSTIESFDPSYEEQHILTIYNAVFNGDLSFKQVNITDELVISSNNSGFSPFNLLNNVWSKSKTQDIPFFKFKNIDVENIEVGTINNLSVAKDFVRLSENSVVSSSKSFDKVKIQTMRFAPGISFNGVDISALNVWLPSGDRKISNTISTKSITIEGDMKIFGFLNDLNMSNIMLTKLHQTCLGKNVFEFALLNHLETNHISCDTYNNINFTSYAANSVLSKPSHLVLNKQFKILNGLELDIKGQLNGYNFKDTNKRLVTLNTFQDVHSKVFSSDLKVDTLFAKFLDEREFSYLENNIVLIDMSQKNISGKTFQKTIWSNIFSVGEINKVNVTQLQKNAFHKKYNNMVPYDITFVGDIEVEHVYVNNATIDGVNLQFLISLSKNFDAESILLKSMRVKNIEIMKLINGCNLTSTINNAVLLTKDEQLIDSFKFINSLVIIGNLHGKCSINGISLSYLNTSVIPLVANRGMSGNFFFKNISIKYLNVLQLSNGLDLTLLMNDSVTFKDSQVIKGFKTFTDLSLGNAFIDSLYVSQALCDVNSATLFNTAVMKDTVQKLPAHTIHHLVANTVVLKGKLNEVKIPKELVLADKTETIHAETIINSTVALHSDLRVFGNIDDVQLLSFLNGRVTLFGNERLVTSLTFKQDSTFKNDTTIRGLLNNIKINKIVKNFSKQIISGNKVFKFNLTLNEIHVENDVNYFINVNKLSQSIVKHNMDEDLSNMVVFDAMNTSSLLVSKGVGNTSIFEIWDVMHLREVELTNILNIVAKKLYLYRETLFDFKDTRDYQVSTYGYFEQHQFMNISHSKKFFPVYEPPIVGEESELLVSDMIIWVHEDELCKTGLKCCDNVYSYKMTILNNGSLAYQEKTPGKTFHFNLKLQQEDVVGFVVQAYQRCSDNISLIDIETLHYSNSETLNTLVIPPNSTLLDARLLEVKEEIFIVIAFNFKGPGEKIYVYRYEVLNDAWPLHKTYYPWNPTSIDLVVIKENGIDTTYMAVTGYSSTPGIVVYEWLNDEHSFSDIQSVSTSVPGTVKWISQGSDLFLFHAKEKSKEQKENSWVDVYTEPIEVYSFFKILELNHAINIQGIHMLETFKFSDETYVLAASRHLQTVYVIQWRGYNGFEVIQDLQAPGVEGIAVYTASNNELMLAIASTTGHTKILKAQFRGPIKYLD